MKSNHVTVALSNAYTWNERHMAVGSNRCGLEVKLTLPSDDELLLQHRLSHNVYLGDEDDDPSLELFTPEWEIVGILGRRVLKVTLMKAMPMKGVAVWWSRLFERGECASEIGEVDTGGCEGRKIRGEGGKGMKEAWEEAHRMFKEKIKIKEGGRGQIGI